MRIKAQTEMVGDSSPVCGGGEGGCLGMNARIYENCNARKINNFEFSNIQLF